MHPYERQIIDLESELAQSEVRLAMVRELHKSHERFDGTLWCPMCVSPWPCPTYSVAVLPFAEIRRKVASESLDG